MRKRKVIKAWAGIVNDTIDTTFEDCPRQPLIYAIYKQKKEARLLYEKIVPVEIHIKEPK